MGGMIAGFGWIYQAMCRIMGVWKNEGWSCRCRDGVEQSLWYGLPGDVLGCSVHFGNRSVEY